MGKYEVRQSEWEAVMGNNPSGFKGADLPVEQVSWEDCHEFIGRLNALTGLSFKLPTEAQWEYACLLYTSRCVYETGSISMRYMSRERGEWYKSLCLGESILTG